MTRTDCDKPEPPIETQLANPAALFRESPDVLAVFGSDGAILCWNEDVAGALFAEDEVRPTHVHAVLPALRAKREEEAESLVLRLDASADGSQIIRIERGAASAITSSGVSEPDLRSMLDRMDQGVVLYERNGQGEDVVRYFNETAADFLELPPGMLKPGIRRRDIVACCAGRGDQGENFDMEAYLVEAGERHKTEVMCRRPSGRWVLARSIPRQEGEGCLTLYLDVSNNVTAERRLKQSQSEYRLLAETAPTGIVRFDAAGGVSFANGAASRLFACGPSEIDLQRQIRPVDGGSFLARMAEASHFEAELSSGHETRHVIAAVSVPDEATGERVATFTDITPLKEARSQIEHAARHDPLTGLGNRMLFNARWRAIEEAGEPAHLIALDLDHFKTVNDDHGHSAGDHLLCVAASRIRAHCGASGEGFRLGGDEFAIILPGVGREDALACATRIVEALSLPVEFCGIQVLVGCSAGLAALPQDGSNAEDLQRAADLALYQVKRNGRNGVACFDPEQERAMIERRRLESDLARAIAHEEFYLVYQPQVDLKSGRTTGMEALLRWRNGRLGRLVPPPEFIPIAESCGLIQLIDIWVIKAAAAHIRSFMEARVPFPTVSLNLSPISLARPEIVGTLVAALAENGVPPHLLEIEITEGVAMAQKERVGATLAAIQAAGMKVAIDDFGAGHSSLAYIQSLPVDRVKIDSSIIRSVGHNESTQAIVSSIHDLCGRLGLKLTAEGVETAEQWEELRKIGSIEGQGFYLASPELPAEIIRQLRSERDLEAVRARLVCLGVA